MMKIPLIDTDRVSTQLRDKAVDLENEAILITNFSGSDQESDFTEPSNCNGFGRVRHFKYKFDDTWIRNPLPNLPAAKVLNLKQYSEVRSQVFQNSVCNWRCWYCFVDFKLLSGNSKYSSFLTCDEMLDLYLEEEDRPRVIDLTGGQPDLTPEWVPWMMQALKERGLDSKVFLWSDDNLSNDYFWQFLSDEQIDLVSRYRNYSRVCCFKGIDKASFSANTKAHPNLFEYQFELCKRLLSINLDLYCYVTFTAAASTNFEMAVPKFLDKLQFIDELLPLRTVPLKVEIFTPVNSRMNNEYRDMLVGQNLALDVWKEEMNMRFSKAQLDSPITEIPLTKY